MTLQTLNVGASSDDAHERNGGTNYSETATDLELDSSGSTNNYYGGFRFTGANWSQGDTINSATLKLYAVTGTWNFVAYCEDADASATWSSTDTPYDRAGSVTTASTTQTAVSVTTSAYNNLTMTSAVQEVTDRGSWGGSVITFIIVGKASDTFYDTRVKSFDSATANSTPELDIDYTAGGGGGSIPVFSHHYKMLRSS